jgi:hypothetical protein
MVAVVIGAAALLAALALRNVRPVEVPVPVRADERRKHR